MFRFDNFAALALSPKVIQNENKDDAGVRKGQTLQNPGIAKKGGEPESDKTHAQSLN